MGDGAFELYVAALHHAAQRLERRVVPHGRPFVAQFNMAARQPPVVAVSQ